MLLSSHDSALPKALKTGEHFSNATSRPEFCFPHPTPGIPPHPAYFGFDILFMTLLSSLPKRFAFIGRTWPW